MAVPSSGTAKKYEVVFHLKNSDIVAGAWSQLGNNQFVLPIPYTDILFTDIYWKNISAQMNNNDATNILLNINPTSFFQHKTFIFIFLFFVFKRQCFKL